MEVRQGVFRRVREQLRHLLATSPPPRPSSTEHSLAILEQKWESVASMVQERKVSGAGAGRGRAGRGRACVCSEQLECSISPPGAA